MHPPAGKMRFQSYQERWPRVLSQMIMQTFSVLHFLPHRGFNSNWISSFSTEVFRPPWKAKMYIKISLLWNLRSCFILLFPEKVFGFLNHLYRSSSAWRKEDLSYKMTPDQQQGFIVSWRSQHARLHRKNHQNKAQMEKWPSFPGFFLFLFLDIHTHTRPCLVSWVVHSRCLQTCVLSWKTDNLWKELVKIQKITVLENKSTS